MPDGATLPILDHELVDDEFQWMKSVYAEFSKAHIKSAIVADRPSPADANRVCQWANSPADGCRASAIARSSMSASAA